MWHSSILALGAGAIAASVPNVATQYTPELTVQNNLEAPAMNATVVHWYNNVNGLETYTWADIGTKATVSKSLSSGKLESFYDKDVWQMSWTNPDRTKVFKTQPILLKAVRDAILAFPLDATDYNDNDPLPSVGMAPTAMAKLLKENRVNSITINADHTITLRSPKGVSVSVKTSEKPMEDGPASWVPDINLVDIHDQEDMGGFR